MTKKKTKRDDVVGLVKCLKIRHSPKGPIATVPMEEELARIDRTAPVQFREQLYEETIERQEAVLENGGQPDRLHQVDAVIEDGPEGRSVRAVRDREQDEISYLTADSWHRIEATERHHRKLCEEATLPGSAHGNLDPPRIRAEVIRGAKDPLAVATEVSIRITMGHQTPVSDSERIRGVYTLKDLNPEMSNHEIGDAVGYSHVHVARLLAQRKITQALQKAGTQVPANKALLEEMANVPEKVLPELAKLLAFEKWSSESLRQANSRATRISEANWDGLKDYRGEPSWAPRAWELISEVECLRLAHAVNKEGWTDEQLIWGAKYVYDLHGSEDKDEKREYREMLAGHLDPDSWMAEAEGWKELEPITWEPAPPAPEPKVEPQPAPAGSGSAGPAEGTPAPVVTANRKEQVQSPAASEGVKAEEGAAPRSAGSGSAAATQTEVGVMAPCRILIEDMRSSVGKLKERRPVLAKLATPEDRAALRAIAKVLADLERSLRLLNA